MTNIPTARHIEGFTRRALSKSNKLVQSTAGGQASLQTLVEEPNFAIASFLLSVLGEGTFFKRGALINAVRNRHESLGHTAGLNTEVLESLVLLATGSWDCPAISKGHNEVSALHTRHFM